MCSGTADPQPAAEARELYWAGAHVPFVPLISRSSPDPAQQNEVCCCLQISAGPGVLLLSVGSSCGLETMQALR